MGRRHLLIRGSAWSVGGLATNQFVALLVLAFLARHLDAREFGIVAIVVLALELTREIALAGLPDYLVRKFDWDEAVASSGFWFHASAGIALTGLAVLIGFALQALGWNEIGRVTIALAPIYLIEALSAISNASLRHRLQFGRLALSGFVAALASCITAVAVVLEGGGYWALVLSRLVGAGVGTAMIATLAGWVPRTGPSLSALRPALGFSIYLAGGKIFGTLNVKATDLIVGALGGPALLGAYQLASRALNFVLQTVLGPIQSVALSAFSPVDDPAELRSTVLRVVSALAAVVFPLAAGLSAVSPEFVRFVFGPQWGALSWPMSIIMWAGVPACINYLLSPVLVKSDRPALLLHFTVALTVTGAALTAVAAPFGLAAVAAAFLLRTTAGCAYALVILRRTLNLPAFAMLAAVGPALVGALIVSGSVALARPYLPSLSDFGQLSVLVAVGAVVYAAAMLPFVMRTITDLRVMGEATG